jgi:hypothetical protein
MTVTQTCQNEITRLYDSGMSGYKIAAQFNLPWRKVYKILAKQNVGIRSNSEISRMKYPINISFFDTWSPIMAYWLGFLCADGCLYKNYLSIGLQPRDEGHLEKLRLALGSAHSFKKYKRSNNTFSPGSEYYRFCVGCEPIANRLTELGFRDFKLGNPKLILLIPDNLFSHWLRGMTDGDGTVCFIKSQYPCWRLVNNCESILSETANRINILFGEYLRVYRSRKIFVITCKRRKGMRLLDRMYKNNFVALDRKKKAYEIIKSTY